LLAPSWSTKIEVAGIHGARQIKPPEIEFWFDFGSTYSYPAAMRIEEIATTHGVTVVWRAFLLGPIFQSQGWQDSPFNLYPAKGRYMWADMQRICRENELEFSRPSDFPRNGLLTARIACAYDSADWIAEFIRRVFTANFALDLDIADPEVITACLELLDQDPIAVMDTATTSNTKLKLRERTTTAQDQGLFGAPSFIANGELFWGNERLGHALAHATQAP